MNRQLIDEVREIFSDPNKPIVFNYTRAREAVLALLEFVEAKTALDGEAAVTDRNTAGHSTQIEITCVTDDDVGIGTIQYLLETAGVSDIKIRTQPHYGDWLERLPKGSIPGLSDACRGWIHHWGSGGGDQSSETCITSAIDETDSDIPAELAEAICGSVSEYSKSAFEAENLTMTMVDDCIAELRDDKSVMESDIQNIEKRDKTCQ